jgi:2-dehydropantoate 2-reductase
MSGKPRVLIMGCGGIGGVVAAHLARMQDTALHVVSSNPDITTVVAREGLTLTGTAPAFTVHPPISSEVPSGPFDFILLATQPTQIEEAAGQSLNALAKDGAMVVLANGLCEQRVAAVCGDHRVFGGIVSFGATAGAPGHVERTSSGGITIGRLDGKDDARLDLLAAVLSAVGPILLTHNLHGARFSKLALNCAVTGLGTIAGTHLGALLSDASTRNTALSIMREAVAVAQAEAITLEPIGGTFDLDWLANPYGAWSGPSHWVRHGMLMAVGFKYKKLRSSMLRAIARGRTPAVDFVNGEVARLGKSHGVPTPINRAVTDIIHRIGTGELSPSPAHLHALAVIRSNQA